jgi:hypothetical protein
MKIENLLQVMMVQDSVCYSIKKIWSARSLWHNHNLVLRVWYVVLLKDITVFTSSAVKWVVPMGVAPNAEVAAKGYLKGVLIEKNSSKVLFSIETDGNQLTFDGAE